MRYYFSNPKTINKMRKLKLGVMALSLAFVFTACSSDDDTNKIAEDHGSLKILASATYGNSGNKTTNSVNENISLSNFLVNFEEIELEFADEDSLGNSYGSDDDIKLKGPFEFDLLSGESFYLVDVELPNGIYEEIEFEFDKSENPESELFGKSMLLKGEINGTPFVFWHDFDEEIEIDFEDSNKNLVIDNNEIDILINFDLNSVLAMVDLTLATDNDGDGTITISPNDQDGNNALAEALKEAIKNQIDLMEDLFD